jgi:hypothetical protein
MPPGDRFIGITLALLVARLGGDLDPGGFERRQMCVCSGGIGSGLSMAEAKRGTGWGHSGLNSHGADPHLGMMDRDMPAASHPQGRGVAGKIDGVCPLGLLLQIEQ